MFYLKKSIFFLLTASFSVAVSGLDARIGESRNEVESRLFGSGGIVLRDAEAEANRQKGMPYLQYLDYLEGSVEVRIYFKTDDGRTPKSSEIDVKRQSAGWNLHVVYVRGKSAIEVYKRSQSISEFEMNELLARQAGGAYWMRKEKPKEGDEIAPSAFGYDMERSDGAVRAKRLGGDAFMIFDTLADVGLANLKESDLMQKAPVSIGGF
jgi:hypothetical protein